MLGDWKGLRLEGGGMKRPHFFKGTMRQWKAGKRKEFAKLVKAVDQFQCGCAYTPTYPVSVNRLIRIMEQMQQELSVKRWGR